MDLVRDVLDKAVIDRNGRPMGRVDGIVLALPENKPPRVAEILIGPSVLGERVHARLGRWLSAVERALGIDQDRPVRIPFTDVVKAETNVKIRVAVGETSADSVERWLRRWVARLPGSG